MTDRSNEKRNGGSPAPGNDEPVEARCRRLEQELAQARAALRVSQGRLQAASDREAALRKSEERFRVALSNTPMNVYHCDRELRYTWQANPHPDWPPERIIGRRDDEVLPPRQAAMLMAIKQRVLETGAGTRQELSIETSLGREIWDVTIEPLRDAAGTLVGLTMAVLEISQRKQAEEALRDREARLRLALGAGQMGAWEWDIQPNTLVWSPALYALLGLPITRAAPTVALFYERIHPEDRGRLYRAVQRAVAGQGEYDVEFRVIHPDGTVRWLAGRGAALQGEDGTPLRMYGVSFDITERKQAEERVQRVFEQAAVGIALIAEGGGLLQVNRRLCDILGYGRDELRDMSLRDITHAGDLEVVQARLADMLAGRLDTFTLETRHLCKDGSLVWAYLSVSLVTPAPIERSFIAVVEDITARKRYEQAIAEEARHKDEFLAMLGHELRNPLAAIRNAVELQKMLPVEHAVLARARDVIERQATHMARLIDDLLDVSRIARGKIQLKKRALDLAELVATVVDDHGDGIAGTGLDLRLHAAARPIWVLGDPTRLAQVVGNLLDNAAKFTDAPGAISVCVAQHGDEAVIEVGDTGIGIEPAMLTRIFDVFQQAHDAPDRCAGGLGLGLSLVRGLVALHAGSVEARSQGPGTGASFLIRLPATSPPAQGAPSPAPAGTPAAQRILVVDDNDDSAEVLRDLLQLAGHQVAVAHDGPEALAVARGFRPDTVICDIGLPGDMSGYDVARALRGHQALHAIRLVAVTGYGRPEDRERAFVAGFDHHLIKPITMEHLQEVLDQDVPARAPARTDPA